MNNKYLTIYSDIVEEIKTETLKRIVFTFWNELKDTYNTSRETIRKALNLLSQNGYIQR